MRHLGAGSLRLRARLNLVALFAVVLHNGGGGTRTIEGGIPSILWGWAQANSGDRAKRRESPGTSYKTEGTKPHLRWGRRAQAH